MKEFIFFSPDVIMYGYLKVKRIKLYIAILLNRTNHCVGLIPLYLQFGYFVFQFLYFFIVLSAS